MIKTGYQMTRPRAELRHNQQTKPPITKKIGPAKIGRAQRKIPNSIDRTNRPSINGTAKTRPSTAYIAHDLTATHQLADNPHMYSESYLKSPQVSQPYISHPVA